jgi:hypothetical protein
MGLFTPIFSEQMRHSYPLELLNRAIIASAETEDSSEEAGKLEEEEIDEVVESER